MTTMTDDSHPDPLLESSIRVVVAYLGRNAIKAGEIPDLIGNVHRALVALGTMPTFAGPAAPVPAVPIRKSVTPEHIICLEDGKKFKALKRHLATLGMTPEDYRTKWGLPGDYPMVAPNYSSKRAAIARSGGLGRRTPAPSGRVRMTAEA